MKLNELLDSEHPQNNKGNPVDNSGESRPKEGPAKESHPDELENNGLAKPSEEEQELYNTIVAFGIKMMSGKDSNAKIIEVLRKGKGDPSRVLAKAAMLVSMKVYDKLKGKVPPALMMQAATEILEHVADFAVKSGVLPVDQAIMDEALVYLMKAAMEALPIPPDVKQSMMEGAKGLMNSMSGNQQQEPQQPGGIIQRNQ